MKGKRSLSRLAAVLLVTLVLVGENTVNGNEKRGWESWTQGIKDAGLPGNFEEISQKITETGKKIQDVAFNGMSFVHKFLTGHRSKNKNKDALSEDSTGFSVTFENLSPLRTSLYWEDDNEDIHRVADLIEPGASVKINTFEGHHFSFTREGTRDVLGDPFRIEIGKSLYSLPQDAKPSEDPCADRYRTKCKSFQQEGECQKNPGWMIVNCPKACDACELLDPHKRCDPAFLNVSAEPVWKPGDMDKMFERILTDFDGKFGLKLIGKPPDLPWVLQFDEFLSDVEVETLLSWGKRLGYQRSTDTGQANDRGEVTKVFSKSRTSSNAWCTGGCEEDPIIKAVSQRIVDITHIPYENYEQFQLLEYQHGQEYRPHHDMSPNTDGRAGGVRVLTFFLYLSDVEEGGETEFPKLDLKVKPKKGRAILWPSVLDENPMGQDPRTLHAALPVIKGEKYAANHWIHSHDFKTANKWGCTGAFD